MLIMWLHVSIGFVVVWTSTVFSVYFIYAESVRCAICHSLISPMLMAGTLCFCFDQKLLDFYLLCIAFQFDRQLNLKNDLWGVETLFNFTLSAILWWTLMKASKTLLRYPLISFLFLNLIIYLKKANKSFKGFVDCINKFLYFG